MPLIAHILLYAAYAAVATFVGVALAAIGQAGGADAFLGGLALFCALAVTHAGLAAAHAAGAVGRAEKRLQADSARLRSAHKDLTNDVDAVVAKVDQLDRIVGEIAHKQAEAVGARSEVKLVEQIVEKLAGAMDARIEEVRRLAAPRDEKPLSRGPIDIVREALSDNRVELHLQPVVTLPQRKTIFYEGFTRLRDANGRLILPQEFIPAAEAAGLMSYVDNMLLFRCVQIVRKLSQKDRRVGIFCNLAPRALSDDLFFPQFLDFMRQNEDMAGSLMFEIPFDAYANRTSIEARAMAKLFDLGFRFSLDRVTQIDAVDLADLERTGVRYLKAPGDLLVDQLITQGLRPRSSIVREIEAADVPAVCLRYGIELVAERVESEETVKELLDLDISLAQGHLFGAPRAIKESLMSETAPPPEFLNRARG